MTTVPSRFPHVLMITSEWPTPESPADVPFVVRHVAFLRHAGVTIDLFAFRGDKQPHKYLQAWAHLRERLRHRHYDLIHAQFGQSGILALPRPPLPLVVTFRGDDLEGIIGAEGQYTLAGRSLQIASQVVARAADEVIAVSERLAQYLPQQRCHIIPSGLDLETFRPMPMAAARAQLGLPLDKRLVLFAANPAEPRKRFWLAQAAIAQLAATHDVLLVTAHGVLHHQIALYMNACDVLLLPSLHEGSPNVVKEALACNTPVVSTDVGDVRARIGSIDGCIITGDTVEQVASAVDTVLRRNGRIAGRATVQHLDERLLTRRVIAVYQQALAKR